MNGDMCEMYILNFFGLICELSENVIINKISNKEREKLIKLRDDLGIPEL